MQCLEVSGAVRLTYRSLGIKGLRPYKKTAAVDCDNRTKHVK